MAKYSPDLRHVVLERYGHLRVGESVNGEVCPSCLGGRTGETSFAVSRTGHDTLSFICHRNSCGWAGRVSLTLVGHPSSGTNQVQGESVHARVGRKISKVPHLSERLSDETSAALLSLYGISHVASAKAGILDIVPSTSHPDSRVAIPIRSLKGETIGYVLRKLPTGKGDSQLAVNNPVQSSGQRYAPKAITIRTKDTDEPLTAWYYTPGSRFILVCEDVFSAIRASASCTSAALLGTNISDEAADSIRDAANGRPVYLCLDKDAFAKSVDLCYKLKAKGLNVTPVFLPKDIKNMTEEEFDIFLKENIDCE